MEERTAGGERSTSNTEFTPRRRSARKAVLLGPIVLVLVLVVVLDCAQMPFEDEDRSAEDEDDLLEQTQSWGTL